MSKPDDAEPQQKPSQPPPATQNEDAEDEVFELELFDQYASFVAGTPFVRTRDRA